MVAMTADDGHTSDGMVIPSMAVPPMAVDGGHTRWSWMSCTPFWWILRLLLETFQFYATLSKGKDERERAMLPHQERPARSIICAYPLNDAEMAMRT